MSDKSLSIAFTVEADPNQVFVAINDVGGFGVVDAQEAVSVADTEGRWDGDWA